MIHIDPAQSRVQMTSELSGRQQLRLLGRILKFAIPAWDKILLRTFVLQFHALTFVLPTVITAYLIDKLFLSGGTSWELAQMVALYMAATLLQWGLYFISQSTLEYLRNRLGMDMRWRYYRHLQDLSLRFYGTRPVGEHMFRCVDDIQAITPQMANDLPTQQVINHPLDRTLSSSGAVWIVSQMINDLLYPIQQFAALSILLASVSPYILLVSFIYLSVVFVGRQWLTSLMRGWDFKMRAHGQGLNAILRETLTATMLTQACGRERTARRWFGAKLLKLAGVTFRRDVVSASDTVFIETARAFFELLLFIFIGYSVITGDSMTVGDYYIVIVVFPAINVPVLAFIQAFQFTRLQLVPAERMLGTLDLLPDVADKPGARVLESTEGHVKLESVTFAYDDEPVLRDVSIEARPGEKIALVGKSGCGKSTVAKLVLRLYDADAGQVTIDGVGVSDVTQESLRKCIGAVMQDTFVFAASVRDNILYARPDASEEMMLRAARLARVDEFVDSLPDGYDTMLSEGGNLSGGQRQRICLARVLLRGARMLILDEATSALDPLSEHTIVSAVDDAFASSTRIVIAHNLAAIADADRIYVLDKGRVVETGKHDELMEKKGFYYGLWGKG